VRSSPIPFAMLGLGIIIGAGLTMISVPIPSQGVKCQTYGVTHKVVTAYVLKPPPAPPPEHIVVKEACPQITERAENVSEPEISKADESKPRKRRHHRIRRYWR
jgi:hypothetical protein